MTAVPRVPREDAAEVWQDVLSRAFQVFAYYHWHCIKTAAPNVGSDVRSHTVSNAALESSLMSIRDLDDFFGSSGKNKDDVVAADFQYHGTKAFLTLDERTGINKKLAHLTYRALHERRQFPMQGNPRTWNNADLVNRAMAAFLPFLDYLENTFFSNDQGQQNFVRSARTTINRTLANLNTLAKQDLDFKA